MVPAPGNRTTAVTYFNRQKTNAPSAAEAWIQRLHVVYRHTRDALSIRIAAADARWRLSHSVDLPPTLGYH
jgi:hypothetical protein